AEELLVRPEAPGDVGAVRLVCEQAFGGPGEANLVDALRRNGKVTLSLVAEVRGAVVGHVLFSPAGIAPAGGPGEVVGLAPLAVLPVYQRRGVGSALVRAGLAGLLAAGHGAVVVLGHPGYYPRFGFQPAAGFGLRCKYGVEP